MDLSIDPYDNYVKVHLHVPGGFLTQDHIDTAMELIEEMMKRNGMKGRIFLRMVNYPFEGAVVPGELRLNFDTKQLAEQLSKYL